MLRGRPVKVAQVALLYAVSSINLLAAIKHANKSWRELKFASLSNASDSPEFFVWGDVSNAI